MKHTINIIFVFSMAYSTGFSQSGDSTIVSTETRGPFLIGHDIVTNVYSKITHLHLRKQDSNGWPDSDTLLVIVDDAGNILYRENLFDEGLDKTSLGGASITYDCGVINLPTIGNILIRTYSIAPADEGVDIQLFGINSRGKFVPITSVIPENNFERFLLLDSTIRARPTEVDSTKPQAAPALEVLLWSGFYECKIYYKIYSQGFLNGRDRDIFHFDEIPIIIAGMDTTTWCAVRHDERDTVTLFYNPLKKPPTILKSVVKPISNITFFYAVYKDGWWLHASVDGNDCFLSNDDCGKLGFPFTSGIPIELGDDY